MQYLSCLQAAKNLQIYQLSKEYLFLLLLYANLQECDIHFSGEKSKVEKNSVKIGT